jgi:hypothetical protein
MMRFFTASLVALLSTFASAALAMNLTSPPTKFSIPWANSPTAGGPYLVFPIPTPSQSACAASLTDGFPPLTFQPLAAGGCGPRGQDFNGILKMNTLWSQWFAAGAIPAWDSSFASSISGYPRGALVSQASQIGCYWANTVDANISNPDSGGANWTSACPGGGLATAASTGSANAQIVAATPFLIRTGAVTAFNPGFTNTTATQINVNSFGLKNLMRRSNGGLTAMTGGEVHLNEYMAAVYDGTQWEQLNSAAYAFLTAPDQTLSGGTAPVVDALAFAATLNVDCGIGPLQYVPNTGAMQIVAPTNDGSCFLQVENGTGAAVPTFSGFTNGSSTGDAFNATSGNKFVVHIWRIHSIASFFVKAVQ